MATHTGILPPAKPQGAACSGALTISGTQSSIFEGSRASGPFSNEAQQCELIPQL